MTMEETKWLNALLNAQDNFSFEQSLNRKENPCAEEDTFKKRLTQSLLDECQELGMKLSIYNLELLLLEELIVNGRIMWDAYIENFILSPQKGRQDFENCRLLARKLLKCLLNENVLATDDYVGKVYAIFERKFSNEKERFINLLIMIEAGSITPYLFTDLFDAAAFKIACSLSFNQSGGRRLFCLMTRNDEGIWKEIKYEKKGGPAGYKRI